MQAEGDGAVLPVEQAEVALPRIISLRLRQLSRRFQKLRKKGKKPGGLSGDLTAAAMLCVMGALRNAWRAQGSGGSKKKLRGRCSRGGLGALTCTRKCDAAVWGVSLLRVAKGGFMQLPSGLDEMPGGSCGGTNSAGK
ncbi:MAG: hypothetical protein ACTJLK_02385 [Anaplasma sp.]